MLRTIRIETEENSMTATEWIEDWLKEFPDDEILVERLRKGGFGSNPRTDEEVKAFLEGT